MALHPAEKYAQDVAKGKIKTGKLIQLTVDRYNRDLKNAKKKGWYKKLYNKLRSITVGALKLEDYEQEIYVKIRELEKKTIRTNEKAV